MPPIARQRRDKAAHGTPLLADRRRRDRQGACLPRSGTIRAARLLAEIGDCHARFPDPQSLRCLAGVAPSSRQFRQGQGRQLPLGRRQAAARRRLRLRRRLPPRQSLGRPALQRRHRSWQRSSPRHPYVARAWLYVIWHYRQDRTATTPRSTKPSSGC
ncbi:MAG: transposase [Streptosporangiaceae bacterium]